MTYRQEHIDNQTNQETEPQSSGSEVVEVGSPIEPTTPPTRKPRTPYEITVETNPT